MLDTITHQEFDVRLNEVFAFTDDRAPLELTLIEVKPLADAPYGSSGRIPFSLLFRGPREPVMPQRIYPLRNPNMGDLELFLVPVGPDAQGMCYESIFN